MPQIPPDVVEYLQADFLASARPFCFLVDAGGRLIDSWGDGTWCGLGDARVGDDMPALAPYLIGSLSDVPLKLDYVNIGASSAHVHVVPSSDGHYVILLDARAAHGSLQQKQQAVNELRLTQVQQQKLINRQRELISELIETRSELDHHRREAERGSENKSRFIAMMSHEFRTPLASISNYAELASEAGLLRADAEVHPIGSISAGRELHNVTVFV